MSNFVKKQVTKQANKHLREGASQFEPVDALYEEGTDANGKKTRHKRDLPPGLTQKEERILMKVMKRAHRLDKGLFSICGYRIGPLFFISLIPVIGDIACALFNQLMVVRVAKRADIPETLEHQMLMNNAVSAGLSWIPLAGDVFLQIWKANSRNSALLRAHLEERGRERLAGGAGGMQTISGSTPASTGTVRGSARGAPKAPPTAVGVGRMPREESAV